jgi:hypothetical protein
MDYGPLKEDYVKCTYMNTLGTAFQCNDNEHTEYEGFFDKIRSIQYDKLKDGTCIFVKVNDVHFFIESLLPNITCKIILFTGYGDDTLPDDVISMEMFIDTLNSDKIIRWYAMNYNVHVINHPKIVSVPIGMPLDEGIKTQTFWYDDCKLFPTEQEKILDGVRSTIKPFYERRIQCYSNFHFSLHNRFGNPRSRALSELPKDLMYYEPNEVNRETTWRNQSEYAFVISPLGNGMDCQRTWEALILGCIVIVETSALDILYEGLPVVIVNKWCDVTQELLEESIEKFRHKIGTFQYEKLTSKYWVQRILSGT